jgi:predicted ATPase
LLDSTEKRLFQRLGIFTKIVNVRPEVIFDVLTSLVDKSLVQINMTGDEDPRFYMLGTIREYAFECLAKGDELEFMHRRHLHYFMNLAEGEEDLLEQMAPKTVKQLSAALVRLIPPPGKREGYHSSKSVIS